MAVCELFLLWSTGSSRPGFRSCGSWAPGCGLGSCGTRAWLLYGMCALPGAGIEPVFPALAGKLLSIVPPGKSYSCIFILEGFDYTILFCFTDFIRK